MPRVVFDAQKLQEVLDAVNTGICVLQRYDDGFFRFVMFNPAAEKLFGIAESDILGLPVTGDNIFLDAVKSETFQNKLVLAARSSSSVYYEEDIGRGGEHKWFLFTMMPTRRAEGEAQSVVLSFHPIDDRKNAESQIKTLSVAVEQNFSPIYITDAAGNIQYANAAFYRMTGYTAHDIIGRNPRVMKTGMLGPEYYEKMWQKLSAGEVWRGEFPNRKINGDVYWESSVISPIKDDAGRITHFVAVMEDITKVKLAQEQLEQIAATDALTEVYNRRMGIALLHKNIATARRESTPLSIAFIDLDGLKQVNDTFGHQAGDSFILQVSSTVEENIRDADVLCRMGGDEFMVIFPNCDHDMADKLMGRVKKVVADDLDNDSRFAGHGFSYGVEEYPCAPDGRQSAIVPEISIDEFISRADQKMYSQKKGGRPGAASHGAVIKRR